MSARAILSWAETEAGTGAHVRPPVCAFLVCLLQEPSQQHFARPARLADCPYRFLSRACEGNLPRFPTVQAAAAAARAAGRTPTRLRCPSVAASAAPAPPLLPAPSAVSLPAPVGKKERKKAVGVVLASRMGPEEVGGRGARRAGELGRLLLPALRAPTCGRGAHPCPPAAPPPYPSRVCASTPSSRGAARAAGHRWAAGCRTLCKCCRQIADRPGHVAARQCLSMWALAPRHGLSQSGVTRLPRGPPPPPTHIPTYTHTHHHPHTPLPRPSCPAALSACGGWQ